MDPPGQLVHVHCHSALPSIPERKWLSPPGSLLGVLAVDTITELHHEAGSTAHLQGSHGL